MTVLANNKLNDIGIDGVINAVSNGVRLRTHGHSREVGLLNSIDVSQQEFAEWLSEQTPDNQLRYTRAVGIAGKNITTDLLYMSLDVINDIDDLMQEERVKGPTRADQWKLTLLEAKQKAATDTLRQLAIIQKALAVNQPQIAPTQPKENQPEADIVLTPEQQKQIDQINN